MIIKTLRAGETIQGKNTDLENKKRMILCDKI